MVSMMSFVMTAANIAFALQQTFRPYAPSAQTESISAPPLILAAYGFVWVAVCVYVWMLWQRLGKVERELADVNAKLAKRARV
jgi:CcmD family protein